MTCAYLGPAGTFTEMAVRGLVRPGPSAAQPFPTVPATLAAVLSGRCDSGVVPLENSVSGAVPSTMGELVDIGDSLRIDAEIEVPVRFALMARPGTGLDEVTVVRSHPHAHSQCQRWLAERLPNAEIVPAESTASAALAVAESDPASTAAIAAPIAAVRYGLVVLADGIGEHQDAVTRFVSVRRPGSAPRPTGRDRSSLVVTAMDKGPGVLVDILGELAVRGINLSWIQSWPSGPSLGRYRFFLDIDGHITDPAVAGAVAVLRDRTAAVAFLGSYPRAVDPQVSGGGAAA
jgi:prephenate dehydratase